MDRIVAFFEMGGYGVFVWPSFAIALVVMAAFVVTSLRTLRAREAVLKRLEASRGDRRARRRHASAEALVDVSADAPANAKVSET